MQFTTRRRLAVPSLLFPLMMTLTACQFIPGQTASQGPIRADVVPAFGTKAEPGQPEMLTFPNQVTPQTFATINKPDAQGKFWWVKFAVAKEALPNPAKTEISGDDEDDDPDERSEERSEDAERDSNPASHRIWIPENGDFKINLVVGSRFQVVDSDARDHEATIQFGSQEQLLAGFLELQGPKSRESKKNKPALERKLTIAESLYNVNQTVTRIGPEGKGKGDKDDKKQPWLKLGKRPFPLPASWGSPDGQKYVLNFTNQGVQRFVTRWYLSQTGAQPDYPVGIKEIGPAGGTIELSGVAKLEVPAGAIAIPTVVKLSQALETMAIRSICSPKSQEYCVGENHDFVSPIAKIEPTGLKFSKPVALTVIPYLQRIGRNHPSVINIAVSYNPLLQQSWMIGSRDEAFGVSPTPARTFQEWLNTVTYYDPLWINNTGYFAKVIDSTFRPEDNFRLFSSEQQSKPTFNIQSIPDVHPQFYFTQCFNDPTFDPPGAHTKCDPVPLPSPGSPGPFAQHEKNASKWLKTIYNYYAFLGLKQPPNPYSPPIKGLSGIMVTLVFDGNLDMSKKGRSVFAGKKFIGNNSIFADFQAA